MHHSQALSVSHAYKKTMLKCLVTLVRETYDWFAYGAINDGEEPLKIVKACAKRWISVEY